MSSRTTTLAALALPTLLLVGCLVQPADLDEEPVDDTSQSLTHNELPSNNGNGGGPVTARGGSLNASSSAVNADKKEKPQPDPWRPPPPSVDSTAKP
ncbi:MAG: hypothetical protein MUF54_08990 [Polyangiaceae bacterium]|jgi:hypothetical protein|nr:hypothetical protein [Polyangiaceae bacterium]